MSDDKVAEYLAKRGDLARIEPDEVIRHMMRVPLTVSEVIQTKAAATLCSDPDAPWMPASQVWRLLASYTNLFVMLSDLRNNVRGHLRPGDERPISIDLLDTIDAWLSKD